MNSRLQHLIIIPRGGLGNRLRVIASGLRVCDAYHAKLTIVWKDGDLRKLIQLPDWVEVVKFSQQWGQFRIAQDKIYAKDYKLLQVIPFEKYSIIEIETCYFFSGKELPEFYPQQLLPWLPFFSEEVKMEAKKLKKSLNLPQKYCGIHIRRGDHRKCTLNAPDVLFYEIMSKILKRDKEQVFFLSCENIELRQEMKEFFNEKIILPPIRARCWSGNNEKIENKQAILDLAEILLLAESNYVIGTKGSSFSDLAIILNGSMDSIYIGNVDLVVKQSNPCLSFCTALCDDISEFRENFKFNMEILHRYPNVEWVLLDWGSVDSIDIWISSQRNLPSNFRYIRRKVEDKKFRDIYVKNEVMKLGNGRWLMILAAGGLIDQNIVSLALEYEGLMYDSSRQFGEKSHAKILVGRELYYYLGGFDETLDTGDDVDLIERMKRFFPRHIHHFFCANKGIDISSSWKFDEEVKITSNNILLVRSEQNIVRVKNEKFSILENRVLIECQLKFPVGKNICEEHASGFYSHHDVIYSEVLKLNKLSRTIHVLEWGSGLSTQFLCERLKKDSKILSLEHDEKYRVEIPILWQSRLTQKILQAQKPFGQSKNYATYPLLKFMQDRILYDLIIIDGRNRTDCIAIAALVLSPEGVVILHDAQRKNYQKSFHFYKKIKIKKGNESYPYTAILSEPVCTMQKKSPSGIFGIN